MVPGLMSKTGWGDTRPAESWQRLACSHCMQPCHLAYRPDINHSKMSQAALCCRRTAVDVL